MNYRPNSRSLIDGMLGAAILLALYWSFNGASTWLKTRPHEVVLTIHQGDLFQQYNEVGRLDTFLITSKDVEFHRNQEQGSPDSDNGQDVRFDVPLSGCFIQYFPSKNPHLEEPGALATFVQLVDTFEYSEMIPIRWNGKVVGHVPTIDPTSGILK